MKNKACISETRHFLFPELIFWLKLIKRICLSTHFLLKGPHLEAITPCLNVEYDPGSDWTIAEGWIQTGNLKPEGKNGPWKSMKGKMCPFALGSKRPRLLSQQHCVEPGVCDSDSSLLSKPHLGTSFPLFYKEGVSTLSSVVCLKIQHQMRQTWEKQLFLPPKSPGKF